MERQHAGIEASWERYGHGLLNRTSTARLHHRSKASGSAGIRDPNAETGLAGAFVNTAPWPPNSPRRVGGLQRVQAWGDRLDRRRASQYRKKNIR